MGKGLTAREKFVDKQLKKLHQDIMLLREANNLFTARLNSIQDEVGRLAVEERAIVKGIKAVVDAATKVVEKNMPQPDRPAGIQ